MKVRAEINKTESKKTIQRTNESKNYFFWKINRIDCFLDQLIKERKRGPKFSELEVNKKTLQQTPELLKIL